MFPVAAIAQVSRTQASGPGIAAIAGLQAVDYTTSGFGLIWDTPSVQPDSFDVQCRASGGEWGSISDLTIDGSNTSIGEADLFQGSGTANTTYEARIRATIGAAHGPWSTVTQSTNPLASPPVFTSNPSISEQVGLGFVCDTIGVADGAPFPIVSGEWYFNSSPLGTTVASIDPASYGSGDYFWRSTATNSEGSASADSNTLTYSA